MRNQKSWKGPVPPELEVGDRLVSKTGIIVRVGRVVEDVTDGDLLYRLEYPRGLTTRRLWSRNELIDAECLFLPSGRGSGK
jgi:hypothetical protein